MPDLYPVFEVPVLESAEIFEEQNYKPSVRFDFVTGDFLRDGAGRMIIADGKDAWIQWCIKTVHTERLACMAYSSDIGTEMEDALRHSDVAAVESAVERTITEALMTNPRTEYLRGFVFAWSADALHCSFTVKGKEWDEQLFSVIINT